VPIDDFRSLAVATEEATRARTVEALPSLGSNAPRCWEGVWQLVEALYSFATCRIYCPGVHADHTPRLLTARATNLGLGALNALSAGHYDAALLIVRGTGELGNVTTALMRSSSAMDEFKGGRRLRGREYAILGELGIPPIVSGRRFGLLSERAVHPSFDELSATHTPGIQIVGSAYQDGGFLLGLNELAIALGAFVHLTADRNMSGAEREAIARGVRTVSESIGGVLIDNLPPGFTHPVPEGRWRNAP
jgi:hypothetical protein